MAQEISNRIYSLQFFRFLAFVTVFRVHVKTLSVFGYSEGHVWGVTFFFVLSGFLCGYMREKFPEQFGIKDAVIYMWVRLKRIYPLFLITLILFIPFMYAGGYYGAQILATHNKIAMKELIIDLLKNIFLVQTWDLSSAKCMCGYSITWFLSAMVFMWLLTLPMMWLIKKLKSNWKVFLLAVFLLMILTLYTFGSQRIAGYFEMGFLYTFPPARSMDYFIGMCVGYIAKERRVNAAEKKKSMCNTILFSILEIIALALNILMILLFSDRYSETAIGRALMWIIPIVVLIYIFSKESGIFSRIFSWKPLVTLGNISFEAYLIHGVICAYYLWAFRGFGVYLHEMSDAVKIASIAYMFITTELCSYMVKYRKLPFCKGNK